DTTTLVTLVVGGDVVAVGFFAPAALSLDVPHAAASSARTPTRAAIFTGLILGRLHAVRGPARDRRRATPLPQLVLVEAVGEVTEREAGDRLRPGNLPAGAVVAEGLGRHGSAHPPHMGLAVGTSDHETDRPVRGGAHVIGEMIADVGLHVVQD